MKERTYRHKYLLIDNAHILEMGGLQRTVNQAVKHPEPVFRMDAPWDQDDEMLNFMNVIRDEDEGIFKMWYCVIRRGGGDHDEPRKLAYATSTDGLHWERPELGLLEINGSKKNNYIVPVFDMVPSIIKDPSDIPDRRYKMIFSVLGKEMTWARFYSPLNLAYSADGIHWQRPVHVNPVLRGISDDCFSLLYDADRRKYLLFTRRVPNLPRDISLYESYDLVNWEDKGRVLVGGDEHDPPELYNFYYMTPFRYEDFFLSMVAAQYTSPISETYDAYNCPPDWANTKLGQMDIQLACSRDGRNWHRPVRRTAVIPCEPDGTFDDGGVYPVERPVVIDGQTWIYYLSSRNRHSYWHEDQLKKSGLPPRDSACARLAKMPEDHWVSLDAGSQEGTLLTKPIPFGHEILVNADADGGSVEAEIITPFGQVIEGFSRGECVRLKADGENQPLRWTSGRKTTELSNDHRGGILMRFYLRSAKLYSYTVIEPDPEGNCAAYWTSARWCEIIKHKSDNWDRLSTEPAGGLPPHGGPGPERGQEKPGEMVVD